MNLLPKLTVVSVSAVLSFTAINANLVQAATQTQIFTSVLESAPLIGPVLDYRATGNFTPFDPRLGTLTDVSLSINATGTITDNCFSSFGCAPGGSILTNLGSSTSPILSLSKGIPLPPFPPGITSFGFSSSQSGSPTSTTPFVGFGSIPFQSDIFISFPRLNFQSIDLSGTEEASLTYTYTSAQSVPEPSSNPVLEASVTLGIWGLLLRKKGLPK